MAETFTFGPFELDAGRGTITRDGVPVVLSTRGIALLVALIKADGKVLSKAALMDAAWPKTSIEESNLTVQIAALRKSFGSDGGDWIVTVPRVGYRFVGPRDTGWTVDSGTSVSSALVPSNPALAVLPFTNMSSDAEQEFFADGLAEDLITDLSRVSGLTVIGRHSSFAYKGKTPDLRVVARELGVRYIVEGSVRRADARIRVNAHLIDTVSHSQLWADRLDRELSGVFALQDEIVSRIVNALADVLPVSKPLAHRRAKSLEAYELFVRGRAAVTHSHQSLQLGRSLLSQAIALEPDFAEAHAWIAISYQHGWAYWGEDMKSQAPLALAAAERAVVLDPDGVSARWVLSYIRAYSGALAEGIAGVEAAVMLSPNDAYAWHFLGELKVFEGKFGDALACMANGNRLNPFPPAHFYWGQGFALYAAGHYADAVATLQNPLTHRTGSQRILAASLAQLGRIDEAKTEAAEFLQANPHFTIRRWAALQPFQRDEDRQRFVDGYRMVGLPE